MKTWTSALALIAAGTLLAGSAFAQATAPSGKDKTKSDSSATGANPGGPVGSTDTSKSPAAPPSGSDTTKSSDSSATKSSDMKSSDMKSSDMKSSDMKSSDMMKSSKGDKSAAKSGRGHEMAGGDAEQVRAVQQALKDKGHDPGDIDGKMGPKTQAALRDYQTKEGLKPTGRLDSETMAKLGIEAKTGAADTGTSASPSASPKSGASSATSASPSSPSSSSSSAPSSSAPSSSAPSSSAPGAASGEKSDKK